jgi:hypothetical protein
MQLNNITSWDVDESVKAEVRKTCFQHFLDLLKAEVLVNCKMLTALLYFYNVDEDCFTFASNIMLDLGLQDIMYITGLPIDGKQVSGNEFMKAKETIAQHLTVTENEAHELLTSNNSCDIKLSKLKEKFEVVPRDISSVKFVSYVKAYLLYLPGNVLFCTSTHGTVSCMYLPFSSIR